MIRRGGAVALLAAAFLMVGAGAASAHALYRSSSPANGADLKRGPPTIVITFSELADPKLSVIQVLDSGGRNHAKGRVHPVPGKPLALRIGVGSLPDGVYTVTWRAVSADDGHTTAGSFTFGVNAKPSATSGGGGGVVKSPRPPVLSVIGRWALYWGLAILFAAAVTRFLVFRGSLPLHRPILIAAWALAALGLAGILVAEKSSAQVSFSQLFSSTSGHHLLRELASLGGMTVALVLALIWRRPWSIIVLGLAAVDSMFWHALNSHASAASPVWFNVGVQWFHLLSVATWVGGLVWLVIGLRGRPEPDRPAIARRFSWLAGVTLAVVAATGITRAIDEVGPPQDWGRLFHTSFGITLLVKLGLFVALVALGARNRYLNVPGVSHGTRRLGSLRRTVVAEILVAAGILGATGVLAELAPAAAIASQQELPPERCSVSPGSGTQPTVYTIALPEGNTLQTYVDPGKAGRNTVHFTFFRPSGNELPIASARGSEITPTASTRPLKLLRFDKGHFVANARLRNGRWTFLIEASPNEGSSISAYFRQTIGSRGGTSCT